MLLTVVLSPTGTASSDDDQDMVEVPTVKVPRLSVEFARWFERRVYAGNSKADGHQKAKSTYKLYVRHVERFLLFEQQRTNPDRVNLMP